MRLLHLTDAALEALDGTGMFDLDERGAFIDDAVSDAEYKEHADVIRACVVRSLNTLELRDPDALFRALNFWSNYYDDLGYNAPIPKTERAYAKRASGVLARLASKVLKEGRR